jgi:hypothetical protein
MTSAERARRHRLKHGKDDKSGTPPKRPMTGAERQRRYMTKLLKPPSPSTPVSPSPAPVVADAAGGLKVNVEHLRRWPERVAPWLAQQLGHRAARALRDALDEAIKTVPPEESEATR